MSGTGIHGVDLPRTARRSAPSLPLRNEQVEDSDLQFGEVATEP
jgi:hypothetical protein